MLLDVLVFASPNPGKEQRVADILTSLTGKVRGEEPYTLNYHSYKCQSEEMDLIDYVVYARLVESGLLLFFQLTRQIFEDKDSLEKRRGLQYHQDVIRYIKEEDLLRKPLRYVKLEPHSGFDR